MKNIKSIDIEKYRDKITGELRDSSSEEEDIFQRLQTLRHESQKKQVLITEQSNIVLKSKGKLPEINKKKAKKVSPKRKKVKALVDSLERDNSEERGSRSPKRIQN